MSSLTSTGCVVTLELSICHSRELQIASWHYACSSQYTRDHLVNGQLESDRRSLLVLFIMVVGIAVSKSNHIWDDVRCSHVGRQGTLCLQLWFCIPTQI